MGTKWTVDQQAAIASRNQSLLVAAAAGSGKTAVLKERIIQRLKDVKDPLNVQELLVTTFTKAAAGEMASRIGNALAEELQKDDLAPHVRKHLEEQLNLLPSAHISTLHSFCQWVIKNYFYVLDINPSASIGNDGEMALMRTEVLHDLIVDAYDKVAKDSLQDPYHIYLLSDMFSDDRSESHLEQLVLEVYAFAMAMPNPEKWLMDSLAVYRDFVNQPILESPWGAYFWTDVKGGLAKCQERLTRLTWLVGQPGVDVYQGHLDTIEHKLQPFVDALETERWDALYEAVSGYDKSGYGQFRNTKKNADVPLAIKEEIKAQQEAIKAYLQDLTTSVFSISEASWKAQVEAQLPLVEGLVNLTLDFKQAFDQAKKEAGLMDFNDLEHLCLTILRKPGTEDKDQLEPSDVALALQDHFKEVMVDEYQDTSGVQEAIINLISTERNRFYVGDVKQSIYSFRMADSDLFMSKYRTFKTVDQSGNTPIEEVAERRIDLAKNFRSHTNILAVTNFIFYQIMTEAAAELDYGEKEALVTGRNLQNTPENWVGGSAELMLVDAETVRAKAAQGDEWEEPSEEEESPEAKELELAMIIDKIKSLLANTVVHNEAYNPDIDAPEKAFRPLEYRDIVILRRSLAGFGNRMVEAMRNAGIPAYVEERSGYFESMEIQLLLSLLQIVDNPEQDLPMAAVLHSPMVGLTANQIGQIRLLGKGSLWSLLPVFAETYQHEGIRQFISRMEVWRTMSRRQGVGDLLWHMYETLDYVNYVSAMPDGLVRRANVLALLSRAQDFEKGNFKGLFRFLRFLESLRDAGQDMAVGQVVSEADNVVRIMTIHKSKGLEFPVVFLSGLQKGFNQQDLKASVLLHKWGGLGVKGYYSDYRLMYPSLASLYIKDLKLNALKAEEERILYVALTRARDKLIMTGTINTGRDSFATRLKTCVAPALIETDRQLPRDLITRANSYLDWILMAFARHLEGGNLLRNLLGDDRPEMAGTILNEVIPDRKDSRIQVEIKDGSQYPPLDRLHAVSKELVEQVKAEKVLQARSLPQEVQDRFAFTYKNMEATRTPAKISVSEIKRRFAEQEERAQNLNSVQTAIQQAVANSPFGRKPSFQATQEDVSMAGAHWGTLMHEAMQWLPLETYTGSTLSKALDRLVAEGRMEAEERQRLNAHALLQFFQSDLARRMRESGRIEREIPFSLLYDGQAVYPDLEAGEELFLQGIIDLAFLEDDQWVLVDYKTDRVQSGDDLIRRYKVQLDLYRQALERLTPYPVKEVYIYSFRLHAAILVE